MRDFERLEELSSTVRSGLEAGEVVWAIDHALSGAELDPRNRAVLEAGRNMLNAIADPESSAPPNSPLAQNMIGGESLPAPGMIVEAGLSGAEENPRSTLERLAKVLDSVCKGTPATSVEGELEQALEVFAAISAIRLGQAGGISRSGREKASWLPKMTISPSS